MSHGATTKIKNNYRRK